MTVRLRQLMKKEPGEYAFESKDVRIVLHARDKLSAWRLFWAQVRERGWGGRLGLIVIMKSPNWKSNDDNIAAKTYPTLSNMKLVPWDTLADSLALHLEITRGEADKMLSEHCKKDTWMIPAQATDLEHDWKGQRIK